MQIESSTMNLLLGAVITLQVWIVKELFSVKSRLNLVLARCPQCREFLQKGLVTVLVAVALLSGTMSASAPPYKQVILGWNKPISGVTDSYVLRGQPLLTTNLAAWPVLAIFPAVSSNIAVTNFTLTMEPGSMFFTLTASNNFWGESDYSNVTNTPDTAEPVTGLNLKRKLP